MWYDEFRDFGDPPEKKTRWEKGEEKDAKLDRLARLFEGLARYRWKEVEMAALEWWRGQGGNAVLEVVLEVRGWKKRRRVKH